MNENNEQPANTEKPSKRKVSLKKEFTIIGYVLLIVAVGVLAFFNQQNLSKANNAISKVSSLESQLEATNKELTDERKELAELQDSTGVNNIKKNQYQSVFLKSGQVYFGKITKLTKSQLTLENIYYLQDGGESLIKLGDEMHGPEDVMYIERVNVEFWENLKSDSEISKAIKEFEAQN